MPTTAELGLCFWTAAGNSYIDYDIEDAAFPSSRSGSFLSKIKRRRELSNDMKGIRI